MEFTDNNTGAFIRVANFSSFSPSATVATTGLRNQSSGSSPNRVLDVQERLSAIVEKEGAKPLGLFEKDQLKQRVDALSRGSQIQLADEQSGKYLSTFERNGKAVIEASSVSRVGDELKINTVQRVLNDSGMLTERQIEERIGAAKGKEGEPGKVAHTVQVLSQTEHKASEDEKRSFRNEQDSLLLGRAAGLSEKATLNKPLFSDNAENPHRGTRVGWEQFKEAYTSQSSGIVDKVSRQADILGMALNIEKMARKELEPSQQSSENVRDPNLKKMSFETEAGATQAPVRAVKDPAAIEGHMLSEKLHYDSNHNVLKIEQISGAVVRQESGEQFATLHSTLTYNEQSQDLRIEQQLHIQDTEGNMQTRSGPLDGLDAKQISAEDIPGLLAGLPALGIALQQHLGIGENRPVLEPTSMAATMTVPPQLIEQAAIAMSVVVMPEQGKVAPSDVTVVLLTNAAINELDVKVTQGEQTRDTGTLIAQTAQLLELMEEQTAQRQAPAKEKSTEREI